MIFWKFSRTYDYVIFKDENNLWPNLELKTKARDLNFTLVTFGILCYGHADSLGVKKQVGQKWPFPVVKGLIYKILQVIIVSIVSIVNH